MGIEGRWYLLPGDIPEFAEALTLHPDGIAMWDDGRAEPWAQDGDALTIGTPGQARCVFQLAAGDARQLSGVMISPFDPGGDEIGEEGEPCELTDAAVLMRDPGDMPVH